MWKRRRESRPLPDAALDALGTMAVLEMSGKLISAKNETEEDIARGVVYELSESDSEPLIPGYMSVTTERVLWLTTQNSSVRALHRASIVGVSEVPGMKVGGLIYTSVRSGDPEAWDAVNAATTPEEQFAAYKRASGKEEEHAFLIPPDDAALRSALAACDVNDEDE